MNESNSIKVKKEATCEKAIKMGEQRMVSLIYIEEHTDFSITNQLIRKRAWNINHWTIISNQLSPDIEL